MAKIGVFKYSCAVDWCKNNYYTPIFDKNYANKHFFKIPEDAVKRAQWFTIMNLEISPKRTYLCEDHFPDSSFTDTSRIRLTKFAIPSLKTRNSPNVIIPENKPLQVPNPTCISAKHSNATSQSTTPQKTAFSSTISHKTLPATTPTRSTLEIFPEFKSISQQTSQRTGGKRKLEFMSECTPPKKKKYLRLKDIAETR